MDWFPEDKLTLLARVSSETVLGSGTFCCSAPVLVPGHNSPQMTRKITACSRNLGKFWTKKIQRDQKTQLPLLRCLKQKAKAGYCACSLHSTPPTAKLLQSCPTLCDPIEGSPPGSAVPGIQEHWSGLPFPSPMQESEK